MSKALYILNPETLKFEKQRKGVFKSVRYFFRLLGIVATIAILFNILYVAIFGFPSNTIQQAQNDLLVDKYELLNSEIQHYGAILNNLKVKDDSLYRAVLQMNSVPYEIRKAGTGGSDRYSEVNTIRNNNLIIQVSKDLDQLRTQLKVQQQSFRELFSKAVQFDDKLNSLPSILPVAVKSILRFSDYFGPRRDPFLGIARIHDGIDMCGIIGTPVFATAEGTVTIADREMGYGKMVEIDHGYGFKTRYGHLNTINVTAGQKVGRGTTIGELGNTGRSTGPHLHYEVRIHGNPVNPIHYFSLNLSAEEYDDLLDALLMSGNEGVN